MFTHIIPLLLAVLCCNVCDGPENKNNTNYPVERFGKYFSGACLKHFNWKKWSLTCYLVEQIFVKLHNSHESHLVRDTVVSPFLSCTEIDEFIIQHKNETYLLWYIICLLLLPDYMFYVHVSKILLRKMRLLRWWWWCDNV